MNRLLAAATLMLALTSTAIQAQETTNRSVVGQGICSSGKNYWFQGMKLRDSSLCTKFSFTQFFDISIDWDPKWNQEARKHYCPGSEQDACFMH
jgi:hypothetical protein